jgi:hypothetical protein
VVDSVIQKICHDKWEQEVLKKKLKYTAGYVQAVTSDMYFIEPDKRMSKQTEREDIDDEPVRLISAND